MIVATDIELRVGARLLLESASFQVAAGDRIGLVGRNGAGKTTLAKVLAGQLQPAAGSVRRSGTVGYLPQDPRTGDLGVLAVDRVVGPRARPAPGRPARGGSADGRRRFRGRGGRDPAGTPGWRSGSPSSAGMRPNRRRPRSPPAWACPTGCCTSRWGRYRAVRDGGWNWPGSCRDSQATPLDEPTNHLDADSVAWLRDHLEELPPGVDLTSHDVTLPPTW